MRRRRHAVVVECNGFESEMALAQHVRVELADLDGLSVRLLVVQLSLFDGHAADVVTANTEGRAHRDAHPTERAAARRIRLWSGGQRLRVLRAIVEAGDVGRTDYENEVALALKRPSPGNRRGELVEAGFVVDVGTTRTTDTGSPAIVWVATDEGRAALRAAEQETTA